MTASEGPQIYLITPPAFELSRFPDQLSRVLDSRPVACLRLELATRDAEHLTRAADLCRDVAHARDVAMVISDHVALAERLGLDGVHLRDGATAVRAARKSLGREAIVGRFCGASRHDGMSAGEAGADYISFGPVTATGLGAGQVAPPELFEWWSEMIELPVVAEGALDAQAVARLAAHVDFFGIGEEIWRDEDPAAALRRLTAALL